MDIIIASNCVKMVLIQDYGNSTKVGNNCHQHDQRAITPLMSQVTEAIRIDTCEDLVLTIFFCFFQYVNFHKDSLEGATKKEA